MKLFFVFFLSLSLFHVNCQVDFSGVWQGILIKDGYKQSESSIFYITLEIQDKNLNGKTREEVFATDLYAIQRIKGTIKDHQIEFQQYVIESKKTSSKVTWCSSEFEGKYNDSTGYLKGTFKSKTCRRNSGTFILYRSKAKFSEEDLPSLGHAWRDEFLSDLKAGRNAPEIREKERENFKFKPIYFDYDKDEIKEEYYAYLIEMIRVVNGHSDLRIQVTGHTDADGSDAYNIDLSERRAKAIQQFFEKNGLDLKKLAIDFKGESQPVDNNNTPEGKQHNRRVDFKFI